MNLLMHLLTFHDLESSRSVVAKPALVVDQVSGRELAAKLSFLDPTGLSAEGTGVSGLPELPR